MIPLTLAEIAAVVGGRVHSDDASGRGDTGSVRVTGPPFVDSRSPEAGGLFVAVPGEYVDGHDYATAATAGGAAAVLASRPVNAPAVVVSDPVAALGALASHVLASLPRCRVIGVTGSQGKTGTKDLLAQILDRIGPTIATTASYNNELGLPLTALRADSRTRHLVLEMGARHVGDIGYLAGLVRPEVALVLNVGVAHLDEFGSRQAIAATKAELVESLDANGHAVLNADDPLVAAMAPRTRGRVTTFGSSADADVRITELGVDELGRPHFTLVAGSESAEVAMPLLGEHQAYNAAAATAVALSLGAELTDAAGVLRQVTALSQWRMEVRERADGLTVINDAYNANPDSMRAALTALAAIGRGRRRTVAVLGEMLELGAAGREEHESVGRLAVRMGVSRLVVVGEGAEAIQRGAAAQGSSNDASVFVRDIDAALELLEAEVAPGDVVLVKASRAVGLERVATGLLAHHVGGGEGEGGRP